MRYLGEDLKFGMLSAIAASAMLTVLMIATAPHTVAAQDRPPTTAPAATQASPNATQITYQRPPRRGAPPGETSGGTRGADEPEPPILFADHELPGVTFSAKPVLYFYIPQTTTTPVKLFLSDPKAKQTLARRVFDKGLEAGIHHVELTDMDKPLAADVDYIWSVAIMSKKNDNAASSDVQARIVYHAAPADLQQRLAGASSPQERASLLGQAGAWYDMIDQLSKAIEANPHDTALSDQRSRLLGEQDGGKARVMQGH